MKRLIILLILMGISFSCKKDSLKKDQEILVGYWNWTYTIHRGNYCEGFSFEDTLNPITEEANYSMNLRKTGCVEFFKNDEIMSKYRLVCEHFKKYENGNFEFVYLLNNDKDSKLAGNGFSSDTLLITQFPFKGIAGCEEYSNFFIRE